MKRIFMVVGVVVLVTFSVILGVEIFYNPVLDTNELERKIEVIEGYGFDTIVDMMEGDFLIEKTGPGMYTVTSPKVQILNEMNGILDVEIEILAIISLIGVCLYAEKKKGSVL